MMSVGYLSGLSPAVPSCCQLAEREAAIPGRDSLGAVGMKAPCLETTPGLFEESLVLKAASREGNRFAAEVGGYRTDTLR